MNKIEEIRKLIERATVEHCQGGDLWLTSQIAAEAIEKLTATQKESVAWDMAQHICDMPLVDEAIRNLLADRTGDNATCMVRAILEAAQPQKTANALPAFINHIKRLYAGNPKNHPDWSVFEAGFKAGAMITDTTPAAQPVQDNQGELTCDYCGVETADPWHGSGMLNGVESKHIHACDDCNHKLPIHVQAASQQEPGQAIHYPQCWDTAAYPTLESALSEVYASFKCSECSTQPQDIDDPVTIPRGLIGAACYVIRKHAPESTLLLKLREYTFGAKSGLGKPAAQPVQDKPQKARWMPMETAPRDGTMLLLLVQFDDNATEDSAEPCPTIGANNFDHDGEDVWQFAGWDWSQDCFTQGIGTPVGWLPMITAHAASAVPDGDALRLLRAVVAELDEDAPDAPGHCHAVPGKWDKDGSHCDWCTTWADVRSFAAAPSAPDQQEPVATQPPMTLDFSKPLETEGGEPVKYICADVIEYRCARVCVDPATGVVYSSPYHGLRIRNAVPVAAQPAPAVPEVTPEMIAAAEAVDDLYRMGQPKLWARVYRAMHAAAPSKPSVSADAQDAKLLDFLDTNAKFRMGWEVRVAPVGNLSIASVIMGGKTIREAIVAAIAAQSKDGGAA